MADLYGEGIGSGLIDTHIPGAQIIELYGEGLASGSLETAVTAPVAAFDDFAFFGTADPDPAMTYVAENTAGVTVNKDEGWRRHYVTAIAPGDYPVSDGYAWKRAAFAAVGYKFADVIPKNFVYLENVQVEVLPLSQSTPTSYETPRRISTVVKPDQLNYSPNPSFEVDTASWSVTGAVTLTRDTNVLYGTGTASGRTSWTPVAPLTDYDYEGGSVPSDVFGYFSATPALMTPGYNSAQAVGVTTNSGTNPQGLGHRSPTATTVTAGTMVQCSAWIKAPVGQQLFFSGQAFTAGTSTSVSETVGRVTVTGTGAWQRVNTIPWTWTANFRPGIILRCADGAAANGIVILMDKASITVLAPDTSKYVSHALTQLIPGRRYVASAWMNVGSESELPVLSVDSGPTSARTAGTDGPWRRVYVPFVATTSSATLKISMPVSIGIPNTVWIDQVLAEEGDYPRDYFDGGYGADYLWEAGGTAGKTRSYYYSQRTAKNYILQRLLTGNLPLGIYAMDADYAVPFTT